MATETLVLQFTDQGAQSLLSTMQEISIFGQRILRNQQILNGLNYGHPIRSVGLLGRALNSVGTAVTRVVRGFGGLIRSVFTLRGAIIGLGLGLATRAVIAYADAWQLATNRVRAFVREGPQADQVAKQIQQSVFEISQRTRTSFDDTLVLFNQLQRSQDVLGQSTEELLKFVESVQIAATLGGGLPQSIASGLFQLSQGLAADALRGQELNSILEQLPVVADVIAEALGVTRGQLRLMGEQGQITAKIIIGAFQQADEELKRRFGTTVPTIGQAFIVLGNSVQRFIGLISQATGLGREFAAFVIRFANLVDELADFSTRSSRILAVNADLQRKLIDALAGSVEDDVLSKSGATASAGKILSLTIVSELRRVVAPALLQIFANAGIFLVTSILKGLIRFTPILIKTFVTIVVAVVKEVAAALARAIDSVLIKGLLKDISRDLSKDDNSFFENITDALNTANTDALTKIQDGFTNIGTAGREVIDVMRLLNTELKGLDEPAANLNDALPEDNRIRVTVDTFQSLKDAFKTSATEALNAGVSYATLGKALGSSILEFGGRATDALVEFASGTKSAGEAFRDFAVSVLQDLARLLIQFSLFRIAVSALGGAGIINTFTPSIAPTAGARGLVQKFASGGAFVQKPTYFPLAGGGVGLAGERGPEAVVPLRRAADGSLAVQTTGGGGSSSGPLLIAIGDEEIARITRQRAFSEGAGRQLRNRGNAMHDAVRRGKKG